MSVELIPPRPYKLLQCLVSPPLVTTLVVMCCDGLVVCHEGDYRCSQFTTFWSDIRNKDTTGGLLLNPIVVLFSFSAGFCPFPRIRDGFFVQKLLKKKEKKSVKITTSKGRVKGSALCESFVETRRDLKFRLKQADTSWGHKVSQACRQTLPGGFFSLVKKRQD